MATASSASQMRSQESGRDMREAIVAAPSAVIPRATPPQPGTAVNEPARSIVSRMKRILSRARSSSETGEGGRTGNGWLIINEITGWPQGCQVLCNAKFLLQPLFQHALKDYSGIQV